MNDCANASKLETTAQQYGFGDNLEKFHINNSNKLKNADL